MCAFSSCIRGTWTDEIRDFYGEYIFKIPFDNSNAFMTDVLHFNADYSIEQMVQLINEAGYTADLYGTGDAKRIIISAVKNEFTYYFVIY